MWVMKKHQFKTLFLLIGILVFSYQINAQTFADKKYYLIDSLDLNELSKKERKLIDSSLNIFHNAKHDSIKLWEIFSITRSGFNKKMNLGYSQWLLKYTENKLTINKDSSDYQTLLKKYKGRALNGIGIVYRYQGKYPEAISYYLQSSKIQEEINDKAGASSTMYNIGLIFSNQGDFDKALEFMHRANIISQELNYKEGIGYTCLGLGQTYLLKGDAQKGIDYLKKSLAKAEEIDDTRLVAVCLNEIGLQYKRQGNINKALEYYHKKIKLSEEIGNKEGAATTLTNLGVIYSEQGEKVLALEYYNKGLKIREEISDKEGVAHSYHILGAFYSDEKEYNKALNYYNKSLKIREEIGIKNDAIISTFNIGTVYRHQKDYEKALEYVEKSLKMSRENTYKYGIAISTIGIGNLYIRQGYYTKAKKYVKEGLALSQELGYPERILLAAEALNKVYQKEQNWKEAWKMQELYFTMKDSIRNTETVKNTIKQQAKYEMEKKEQEIALLDIQRQLQDSKLKRNKTLTIFFSAGLGLSLILIFFGYKAYTNKQTINRLLIKQNEEKKAMLKEIHHRVKNNLQVVNSLLKLQSRDIEDQRLVDAFKDAQNRVLSMALLHEKMYRSDDLQHVDVQDHITLLIEDLVKTYAVDKSINLDIKIEEVTIGMRTLVPLGLIINEIITNALKYAFIDKSNGEIMVTLNHLDGKNYELVIGDDGIGLSEEQQKESTGIGTKLIQTFTRQLNGTMDLLDQTGTVYRFRFEAIDAS